MIEINGNKEPIGILSKQRGVADDFFKSRIRHGMPAEVALQKIKGDNELKKQVKHIPSGQVFGSIRDASAAFGIAYGMLRQRIYSNYPCNEFEVIGGGEPHHKRRDRTSDTAIRPR